MNLGIQVTPVVNQSQLLSQANKSGAAFAQAWNSAFSKTQPLGRITGQVSEFEKSMEAANARVIAFGTSAGSIYVIKLAFDKMVSSTIMVQKSLAQINVILGLGATALKGFSSEMFKAAAQTGQTFETASKVALEFARHGVSATETAKRMTSAMQLMRISGLSAEDSVNALTAAINAFNKEGLTSEDVINRMTAVDTRFAISAQDLAKAIQRVGSTAEDAGVQFNQLLGLVTAAQTATARGGAVIGNAFKSIFTRLGRPQVLSDLEAIGVQVRNQSGAILPMVQLLKNLAASYNTLNSAQRSFITEAVGGVYQVNILKAALADLGHGVTIFDKAQIAAANSTGLIEKRMSELNETLDSQLNVTMLNLTKLMSNFGQTAFASKMGQGIKDLNGQIEGLSASLENIQPGDSIIDKIKKTLGGGASQALGAILTGPGIQFATVILIKSFSTLLKFVYGIARDFTSMNDSLHKQEAIQGSINNFLSKRVDLIEKYNQGLVSSNQIAQEFLHTLQQEIQARETINNLKNSVGNIVKPIITATPAGGFIPNFSATDDAERMGAARHGYLAGATYRKMLYDGRGGSFMTTVNGAETVKEFTNSGGYRASMVIPPNGFGSDTIRASNGFIPNFAQDYVFSLLGLSQAVKRTTFGQKSKEHTNQFEEEVNQQLMHNTSLGFQNVIHLAGGDNPKLSGLPRNLAKDVDLYGNNARADFLASYKGSPILFDAKHSGYYDMTLGNLSNKETSMRKLWAAMQGNPEVMARMMQMFPSALRGGTIGPDQLGMKFGSIFSHPPLGPTLRNYAKAGIQYVNLNAAGGVLPAGIDFWTSHDGDYDYDSINASIGRKKIGHIEYMHNEDNYSEIGDIRVDEKYRGMGLSKALYQQLFKRGGDFKGILLPQIGRTLEMLGQYQMPTTKTIFPQMYRAEVAKSARFAHWGKGSLDEDSLSKEQFNAFIMQKIQALHQSPEEMKKFLNMNSFELFTSHSGGYMPALNAAVGREMSAGYDASQIRIGSDGSLVSAGNPSGLGVYNSTEGSLGNGIQLARAAGINPAQKGMAAGFVPNFDIGTGFILGALQGILHRGGDSIGRTSFGYNKNIDSTHKVYESFDKLSREIDAKAIPSIQKYAEKFKASLDYQRQHGFDPQDILKRESHLSQYGIYQQNAENIKNKVSNYGLGTSFIAPAIGGIISAGIQNFGGKADTAKSLETLTEGIGEAAQALFALPNAAGAAIGGILLISKLGEALNQFTSKVGQAAAALDIQKTQLEKASGALNTLQGSYDSLNSLFESGNVDLQSFLNITRTIAGQMAQIAAIDPALARKLSLASTSEERQKIQSQYLDKKSGQVENAAFTEVYEKLITGQKSFGVDVYSGRAEGQFTPNSAKDAITKNELKSGAASLIFKQVLDNFSNSGNANKIQIAKNAATGLTTDNDLKTVLANVNKSNAYVELGDENSKKAVLKRLTEIIPAIPSSRINEYTRQRDELILATQVEVTARKAYNQELQNLLSRGVAIAAFNNQNYLQSFQKQKGILGVSSAHEEGRLGILGLTTAEGAMIRARGNFEQTRIAKAGAIEAGEKRAEGAIELTKLIEGAIARPLTEKEKAGGANLTPGAAQGNREFLDERRIAFSGEAGQKALFQLMQKSPEEFAKGYLGSGAKERLGTGNYEDLVGKLATLKNSDAFRDTTNKTLTNINSAIDKADSEAKEQRERMIAAIEEANFKQLAESLGGLSLLTEKGKAREMHRRITRDEYSEQHGVNSIVRGRAAADLLSMIPEDRRNRKDSYINRLYGESESGMVGVLGQTFRGVSSQYQNYFGTRGNKAAATVGYYLKSSGSTSTSEADMTPLTLARLKAAREMELFAVELHELGQHLTDQKGNVSAAASAKAAIDKTFNTNFPTPNIGGPSTPSSPIWNAISDKVSTPFGHLAITAATLAAAFSFLLGTLRGGGLGVGGVSQLSFTRGAGPGGGPNLLNPNNPFNQPGPQGPPPRGPGGRLNPFRGLDRGRMTSLNAKRRQIGPGEPEGPSGGGSGGEPSIEAGTSAGTRTARNLPSDETIASMQRLASGSTPEAAAARQALGKMGVPTSEEMASQLGATFADYSGDLTRYSKLGKTAKGAGRLGKLGNVPFLADLVDVGSIGLGSLAGGGNYKDTMSDIMLSDAGNRVNKHGARWYGDLAEGASLRGATTSFLGKDIARMNESAGGLEVASKMEEYQRRSKILGIPSLSSFKGNRAKLNEYLDEHKVKDEDSASNKAQNGESDKDMLGRLDLINTNLVALHDAFLKGLNVQGILKGSVGINKSDVTALITSVNAGNPTPAKVTA